MLCGDSRQGAIHRAESRTLAPIRLQPTRLRFKAMVLSGNTGHFYLKRLVTFGSERRTEFEIINTTEVLRAIWLEIAASL